QTPCPSSSHTTILPPPSSPLFPYTTLFRSPEERHGEQHGRGQLTTHAQQQQQVDVPSALRQHPAELPCSDTTFPHQLVNARGGHGTDRRIGSSEHSGSQHQHYGCGMQRHGRGHSEYGSGGVRVGTVKSSRAE